MKLSLVLCLLVSVSLVTCDVVRSSHRRGSLRRRGGRRVVSGLGRDQEVQREERLLLQQRRRQQQRQGRRDRARSGRQQQFIEDAEPEFAIPGQVSREAARNAARRPLVLDDVVQLEVDVPAPPADFTGNFPLTDVLPEVPLQTLADDVEDVDLRAGDDLGLDPVAAGVDFSECVEDPQSGLCCVETEETVSSLQREPILECTHKNVEKCHYTYVTQFEPSQEEVCEENFEKSCQITFKQQAVNETVRKCYNPLEKVCDGQGPEECRTLYESSCTTKYVEKRPGKFVGDTFCEKLPIEICGAGCSTIEGPEECHDKVVTSLIDVPEEVCDLNPQKTCRFQTKLVPRLKPEPECTIIPQETCNLRYDNPQQVQKPLRTKWCLDPTPPTPDETYDESNALASPIGSESQQIPTFANRPQSNSFTSNQQF